MAEAIAIGASVIAIIQITDRIIGLCKFYIETARDAPSDLRAILLETSALKTIFENFNFLTACDSSSLTTASSLSGADGPIKGCLLSVTELEELFPSDFVQSNGQGRSKKRKLKSTLASLAWPLKESKARKLLNDIMRYKSTITLALTTESIQDIKDTKARASEIHDMLTESQRQEVYRWLQHTDPSPIHHRAQKDYEPGTGSWMLRYSEWTSWLEAKDRCLWIHGIPGAGKTVLISYLIEEIKKYCDQSQQRRNAYVYYYCYFAHNQDETKPFLSWLINQLCRKAEYIPAIVSKIYKSGGEPSLADLLDMLACVLARSEVAYIVIDAIDESNPREDLLKVLQDFVADSRFKSLQIIASSREYFDIERIMVDFSVSVSMDNPFVQEDIRCHARSILQSCPQFEKWPNELLHEVEETVTTGAGGMFRWAVCQIDALRRLKCERHIVEKALKSLPKTLDETYDRILIAIPEEERLFFHHVLRWIAHHNELYEGEGIPCAVLIQAVEASTLELTGDRNERFYDKDTLREVCGCLIDISPEDYIDEVGITQHSYISATFAHYTVREYLDSAHIFKTTSTHYAAGEGNLKDRFVRITMSEAQQIEENELWELETDITNNPDIIEAVESNFNNYCVVSALLSLYKWPGQICQQHMLRALAIDLLDPSKPHFETMGTAASAFEHAMGSFSNRDFYDEAQFWGVEWYPETSIEAIHLYNLLLLTESCRECVPLAKTFLQAKDRKGLLQTRVRFEREVWSVFLDGDQGYYIFDGSLVEVFAQLALKSMDAFKLLMEVGAGIFDFSIALLLSIGGHEHCLQYDCKDFCPVERLLELGANPNLKDYKVTPLQIATLSQDLEGVSILLKAGAYPNDTGSSNGVAWEKSTLISHFNHLHGASPLYIHRNYKGIFDECIREFRENSESGRELRGNNERGRELREENRKKIEELLLQYGAEEISATYTTFDQAR